MSNLPDSGYQMLPVVVCQILAPDSGFRFQEDYDYENQFIALIIFQQYYKFEQ